jgi:hypothetical protein
VRSAAFAFAGLLVLVLLVGNRTGFAQDAPRPGQALWRSCSTCHCVPDPRIPEDADWLKLNETTTCISGENDTPEARRALIAYLRAEGTLRPLLIDERNAAPKGPTCGKIRLPSTAGSAYLRTSRKSIRECPPKIRLRWGDSEKGALLALPVGEYRVVSYAFYRKDEQGRRWAAAGSSAEGCADLVIKVDAEAALDLRPEIQAHLSAEASDDGHVLGFFMTNRHDQRMSLARDGKLVNPGWLITDAEGKRIDAGDFEVT